MICARQVSEIERHCDVIAERVLRRLASSGETPHYHHLPQAMVRERVRHLLGNLGQWLEGEGRHTLVREYELLGETRAAERVPLHELVRVIQVIRREATDYSRERNWADDRVAAHAESELEYRISAFFDVITHSAVRGYERVLADRAALTPTSR